MAKRRIVLKPGQRNLRRQITAVFAEMRARNKELLVELETNLGKALLRSGFLIEARAKEILTEKGHVITGNLRRSIATQLVRVNRDRLYAEVGTFVEYAPYVEALPPGIHAHRHTDGTVTYSQGGGGFLFPASEEKFPEVIEIMTKEGVVPALENWARG